MRESFDTGGRGRRESQRVEEELGRGLEKVGIGKKMHERAAKNRRFKKWVSCPRKEGNLGLLSAGGGTVRRWGGDSRGYRDLKTGASIETRGNVHPGGEKLGGRDRRGIREKS